MRRQAVWGLRCVYGWRLTLPLQFPLVQAVAVVQDPVLFFELGRFGPDRAWLNAFGVARGEDRQVLDVFFEACSERAQGLV